MEFLQIMRYSASISGLIIITMLFIRGAAQFIEGVIEGIGNAAAVFCTNIMNIVILFRSVIPALVGGIILKDREY